MYASIGMFTILDCKSCEIGVARIGIRNVIQCNTLRMEKGSRIGKGNRIQHLHVCHLSKESQVIDGNVITGTIKGESPFKKNEVLHIGKYSIITRKHTIDVSDSIYIGDNVVLSGIGSQIWTHGYDAKRIKIQAPVTIGNNVYLGSGIMITQGVTICDDVSVGAGTIIPTSITKTGFYISSKILRKSDTINYSQRDDLTYHNNQYFCRKNDDGGK